MQFHHRVLVIVLIGMAVLPAVGQPARRPMTLEDMFRLKEIAEVQASPNGRSVALVATGGDLESGRTTSQVLLMPASGGEAVEPAEMPEGANHLRWSPNGAQLAFFARAGGKTGIWTYDVAGHRALRVCDYDRSNSFLSRAGNWLAWSPDGTRLAFAGTSQPPPPSADPVVIDRIQYKARTALSDNRRSHLFIVNAAGGVPEPLTSGPYDEHSLAWGGGGGEIVFLSNREPDPDARFNYDLFAVEVKTRTVRRITSTPGIEMDPKVSPDGKRIAFVATRRNLTTIDSVAEDAHVEVVSTAGGPPVRLDPALDRNCSAPAWTPDGAAVVYLAADRGKTSILRVPAAGGASVRLVDDPAQAGPFSIGGDGTLSYASSSPAQPRELFRLPSGGQSTRLTNLNAAAATWQLSAPEIIRFKSFDGTSIEGWLYPSLERSRRSPLLLSIHGGPHGMYGYGFNPGFQYQATRGYATLALNPRGSSGYGQRFTDGTLKNWGGGDYKDLMAGVDYVLRTHPEIDSSRLGVLGSSYGGFMTNWVITHTDRFKAAVSSASLSNLVSFYATSLYQDLVHVEFNGFPWDGDNFALLWKWSPLAHVERAKTPTLLLHGELDNEVHITQAEEMYTALRRRGVETRLVRYPREGHGFTELKHRADQMLRTLEWFDRLLNASR